MNYETLEYLVLAVYNDFDKQEIKSLPRSVQNVWSEGERIFKKKIEDAKLKHLRDEWVISRYEDDERKRKAEKWLRGEWK